MSEASSTITGLLRSWREGDQKALDALLPLVYQEMRSIAARHLRGEREGHTLRPTDLISEAYLRLAEAEHPPDALDRVHFLAICARTMRQILVDHARARAAGKRGGGERAITLDDEIVPNERPQALLALDDALRALAQFDERKSRAVELHYFGGLKQAEIAKVLDVHVNTVARDLRLAEAWVNRHMRDEA